MAQFKRPGKALARRDDHHDDPADLQFEIVAPNCNVCQSPYRRQIDLCLASGWKQTAVIRHFNQIEGDNYFKKDSMSRHRNLHLSIMDKAIRDVIEARARQFKTDTDEISGGLMTKAAALETVVMRGLDSLQKGTSVSEPKDVLAAIAMLEKMEAEWKETAIDEMLREFKAFSDSVRDVVGEELFAAIWAGFEARLGGRSDNAAALNPAPLSAEEVVTEGEYEDPTPTSEFGI